MRAIRCLRKSLPRCRNNAITWLRTLEARSCARTASGFHAASLQGFRREFSTSPVSSGECKMREMKTVVEGKKPAKTFTDLLNEEIETYMMKAEGVSTTGEGGEIDKDEKDGTATTDLAPAAPVSSAEADDEEENAADYKPKEVMAQLDRYIVGQKDAKRTVAVAYRNRWRRHRLPEDLRDEVMPKNILMVGPTGVGKTEIARRLSKLSESPFIKVEATKFTEVGFHGRDVDQIVRDLVEVSINLTKTKLRKRLKKKIAKTVEDKILKSLVGQKRDDIEKWRVHLRDKQLEEMQIELEVQIKEPDQQNMETIASQLTTKFGKLHPGHRRSEKRKMRIKDARPLIEEMEMENLIKAEDVIKEALKAVEQDGIVFIDEIDKICTSPENRHSGDASSEGVQRDLLPIIEGCTISTKHGNVNTDHILFMASGAFSACKPSDLLAELQGRLPLKVELKGLTQEDLYRILTEPEHNLIRQQVELMKTEGVKLVFETAATHAIARVSSDLNASVEDIGARRLHTVIERIVDDISFDAPDLAGQTVTITEDDVNKRAEMMMGKANLKKFII